MNIRTLLLSVFVLLTIALALATFSEYAQVNTLKSQIQSIQNKNSTQTYTLTTTTTSTTTVTNTLTITTNSSLQYPVTFLGPPTGCVIEGLCINATLIDHIGENLTVVLSALFQNATTGQNATIRGSSTSLYYATCNANAVKPTICYLIAYPESSGTFKVTVFVMATDGKTVLSPSATITAKYGIP